MGLLINRVMIPIPEMPIKDGSVERLAALQMSAVGRSAVV